MARAAGVAQAFDRAEAVGGAPLPGQPGVDDAVAEAVGQGVGQQAGQAVEGLAGQVAES